MELHTAPLRALTSADFRFGKAYGRAAPSLTPAGSTLRGA